MKLIHFASLLVLSSSIAVTKSDDQSSDNRKESEISEVVGIWRSPRTTLSIHPDRRFEFNGGAKVEFGIWEESRDGGFYLRYRARNTGESGLSRAGHFEFEQGDIVFYHDDEVERFEKVGEPEVTEQNGIQRGDSLVRSTAEILREEAIAEAMIQYVEKVEGLDINWSLSIAETAKVARKRASEEGVFLAFLIEGNQTVITPPSALLKHGHTHHEAINSTIEGANYEFIWPAAGLNPDGSWKVIVFVRPRKPLH